MEAPHTDNANIDPTLLALDQPCHTSTQYGLAADTVGVPMGVNDVRIQRDLTSGAGPIRVQKQSATRRAGRSAAPYSVANSNNEAVSDYGKLKVTELKGLCGKRRLRKQGTKAELVARLDEYDESRAATGIPGTAAATRSHETALRRSDSPLEPDFERIANDGVNELRNSFDSAFHEVPPDSQELDDDDVDMEGNDEPEVSSIPGDGVCSTKVADANTWIDTFILETRRKSGQQTEKSVLSLWQKWLKNAIATLLVPDIIVDAHHIVEYLKYAATRSLLTKSGREMDGNQRLSSASLKKHMTMLGRVRRRQVDDNPSLELSRPAFTSRAMDYYKALMVQSQRLRLEDENFDVTVNTILDSQLFPEHFEQIEKSIFTMLTQLPSIIKAHLSWTWQCTTLTRGDEITNLPIFCVQPHQLFIPDYTTADGRRSGHGSHFFGVLSLYHETKTAKPGKQEPNYNFVLPHRNPLRCPIGALAILLHYVFDQEELISQVAEWDWSRASTWRQVKLLFGRKVGQPCSADALQKMFTQFLKHTTITSPKKLHLARRTMPTLMEDMGVNVDQVNAIGHWTGNTLSEVYSSKIPKTAVTALAGFYVGEQYNVPWATVEVSEELQNKLFPFAEKALTELKASGQVNHGTVNFLQLLQQLRPFFWRATAAIHAAFPESALLKRMTVLQSAAAKEFVTGWPAAIHAKEASMQSDVAIGSAFSEAATQSAFMSLAARHTSLESTLRTLTRRTEPLSPSHQRTATIHLREEDARTTLPNTSCMCPQKMAELPTSSSEPIHLPVPSANMSGATSISDSLTPIIVSHNGGDFHVLRLTASPYPSPNPYDMILPEPAAFCSPVSMLQPQYPVFTARNCAWASVFQMIKQPVKTWACWGPGNLGDYESVDALHKVWTEGSFVEGVGHRPPLQLVDSEWGTQTNKETSKSRLPSWRPHQQGNVRRQWSQFSFFVTRIEKAIAKGQTASESVQALDQQRGALSMPKFHRSLQPKKGPKAGRQ